MPASEGGDKGIFEEGCVWMQQEVITSMYKKYHIERAPSWFLTVNFMKVSLHADSHSPEDRLNTVAFIFTSFPWGVLSSFSQKE